LHSRHLRRFLASRLSGVWALAPILLIGTRIWDGIVGASMRL
jgi:hypothetical protein